MDGSRRTGMPREIRMSPEEEMPAARVRPEAETAAISEVQGSPVPRVRPNIGESQKPRISLKVQDSPGMRDDQAPRVSPDMQDSPARSATKVLWIILAVIGAAAILPALLGFAGSVFGILVAIVVILFVFIFLAAILTLVFLVAGVAVVAAGIAAAFAVPLDGAACIGLGLVLLALGLIGVVLSVLLYGKLLPWLFRGAIDGLNGMIHRKERTA